MARAEGRGPVRPGVPTLSSEGHIAPSSQSPLLPTETHRPSPLPQPLQTVPPRPPPTHLVGDGQPGQGAEAQQRGAGHGGSGGSHGGGGGQRVHGQIWALLLLHHDGAQLVSQHPGSMFHVWGEGQDPGSEDSQSRGLSPHLFPWELCWTGLSRDARACLEAGRTRQGVGGRL